MGNPFYFKSIRIVIFTILLLLTTISFFFEPNLGAKFVHIVLIGFFFFFGYGIDIYFKKEAINVIKNYMKRENIEDHIVYAAHVHLYNYGRGHLAIAKNWLFFVDEKDKVIPIPRQSITSVGYKAIGTGDYITNHYHVGQFTRSIKTEEKATVFYISYKDGNGQENIADFYCLRHAKFYNILISVWDSNEEEISKEDREELERQEKLKKYLEERKAATDKAFDKVNQMMLEELSKERSKHSELDDPEQRTIIQNQAILKHLDVIVGKGENYLDEGLNNILLHQWELEIELLIGDHTDALPKLEHLPERERQFFKDYVVDSYLKGVRTVSAILIEHNIALNEIEEIDLPGNLIFAKHNDIWGLTYPAIKQVNEEQCKFFKESGYTFLTDDELSERTEETILKGLRNGMANYLAYQELTEEKAQAYSPHE